MNRLGAAARGVVDSGRFISVWSIVIAFPVSLTVLAPLSLYAAPLAWLAATLTSWLCFAAALALIGVLERWIADGVARRVVVVVGVVVSSALRPVLLDRWLVFFGGQVPPTAQLPFRIATNVLAWTMILLAVAIIVDTFRSLRGTNALLRSVIRELDLSVKWAEHFEAQAQAAVERAEQELRHMADVLRSATDDVPDLRALIVERIQRPSHELTALADSAILQVDTDETRVLANRLGTRRITGFRRRAGIGRSGRISFRLPPVGVVATVYIVCVLPYAVSASTWGEVAFGVVHVIGGGAVADFVPRRRAIRRNGIRSSVAFVAISSVVGVSLTIGALVNGAAPGLALMSALVYTGLAILAAVCAGMVAELRADQRRLSKTIATQQRIMRADTLQTRSALRAAGELLHRDGQGHGFIFAMQHPLPSQAEYSEFAAYLDALALRVSQTLATDPTDIERSSIDTLVEMWGRVIDARVDVCDEAQAVLAARPDVARDAYDIVAEGFLNAVKHSESRRVDLTITVVATGSGPHLRVSVTSPFAPAPGAQLRAHSQARALGAHLVATDEGTRLEALIALS